MKFSRFLYCSLFLLFTSACGSGDESSVSISNTSLSEGSSVTENGLRDSDADLLARKLSEQSILFSWREGEAVYGTYFFEEIHFCTNSSYQLFGLSEKNTVLDNVQRNRWQHNGQWQVFRNQGQLGVYLQPNSGEGYFIPLQLEHNGDLSNPYVSVSMQGAAGCY